MMKIRTCRCAVPGCGTAISLMPFLTITEAVDLTDGLCRDCLGRVDKDRRNLLRAARLELRVSPHLAELLFFQRCWDVVFAQAVERFPRARSAA